MAKLTGKVAIVTGASKGIGAEIAKALAAAGAAVAVNYASGREDAERVVAEIKKREGKAIAIGADVSKAADVARLFQETKQAFGPVQIVVNNAGVYQFQPLEAVTEAEFHRTFNINVLGPILTAQEALKQFGPQGGSIINVGSVVSRTPVPNSVTYTASKHALDGITSVLAAELGARKIRVNSLNPGGVNTEGSRTAGIVGSPFEQEMISKTPLGRMGLPQDIAPVAVFLASDDSIWMTGETLAVSGGLR
ncbi:MAG: Glucose 1-dehydrogenase 1 [Pseudomonadota bacterium]